MNGNTKKSTMHRSDRAYILYLAFIAADKSIPSDDGLYDRVCLEEHAELSFVAADVFIAEEKKQENK